MAGAFPKTFETGSQSQNQSAGSNPISYQANVNRQKTRKWVDAKAANYGGDDWGDESDEYDDYDKPPTPVSKQPADNYKKNYGDLPEARPRANSFDADDEKRNFSNQTVVPPMQDTSTGPATRFSQITGVASMRQPSGPPSLSLSTQQQEKSGNPQSGRLGSGDSSVAVPLASSEGTFSTGDYQAHRNYSPTAVPAPLNSRSPGPQNAVDSPASGFPARKSSMGHPSSPKLTEAIRSPIEASQPTLRAMSPTSTTEKALPFVRPADIYRRAEEDRRQSIESGSRPTMISPVESRPVDRTDSPGFQPSMENAGPESAGARRRTSIDRDESTAGQYLTSGLEPVQERKSEYGFNEFSVTDTPKESAPSSFYGTHPPLSDSAKLDVQGARRQSTSPKLPDLNRMSGFGMDIFASAKPEQHSNSLWPPHNQTSNVNLAGSSSVATPESSPSPGVHQQDNSVYHSMDDDEQLAPPRPLSHAPSEQSFRPNIPGGWTSYATTNQIQTPQAEDNSSSLQRNPDSDYDIAPTTTKHALPQSASAVGLADFETGATRGEHDKNRSLPPPPSFSEGNRDVLPTPDHAMAPSGNLYSTTTLDPRLLPKSNPVPNTPPPPPAKDTPVIGSQQDNSGYFPASATYTTDSKGGSYAINQPPILAKDVESEQEENDRLEEEIVRRLSPQPREITRDSHLFATTPGDATRESAYLPDYYFTSTEDEARTPPLDANTKHGSVQQNNKSAQATPTGSIHRGISQTELVAPLSVAKSEHSTNSLTLDRPPVKHRFSWEQSSENVSVAGESKAVPSALSTSTSTSALSGPNSSTEAQQQNPIHEVQTTQEPAIRSPLCSDQDEKITVDPESSTTSRGSIDDRRIARASMIMGGAAVLATGATVAAVEMDSQGTQPKRRASIAEEKATRVSSYPVTITPPEHEHPARLNEPYFPPTSDQPTPSSSVSPINTPTVAQPPPPTSRLLAFKEIMNMKSPHQRIQTFDETRHRFAAMDSGLTNWMEALRAQQPEHANSTGSWAASGPGKATGQGAPAGSTQPPYYQQYLNASSPTGTPSPSSRPGPSSATHQGHSSAGSAAPKITTQQVQAKGKELLHTAGIFGGKAGKVGKGFLAKGKSKFLGGSGDKASPPPKPKHERRSSWGLPLSKPKSSAPSDKSNRLSRQTTPVLAPSAEPRNSATMTSVSSQQPQLPHNHSAGDVFSSGSLSGTRDELLAPHLDHSQPSQQGEPITSVREIRDADQSTTESETELEEKDKVDLGPPRPISKNLPSWDPFNATPIAEEQGSAYDTRTIQQSYPFPLPSVPLEQEAANILDSRGALHNHPRDDSEAQSHGVVEEPESIKNDWVMVTPEAETQQQVSKTTVPPTSMMHRARGSSGDVPILPAQTQREFINPPAGPLIVSHSDERVAVTSDTGEQITEARVRQDEVQADSTFLPPIRRSSNLSSALAFKFGSRKGKQRFPLEDPDEDEGNSHINGPSSNMPDNHAPNPDLNGYRQNERSFQQEDSGYATERLVPVQISPQTSQVVSVPQSLILDSTKLTHEHNQPTNMPHTEYTSQDQQRTSMDPRPPLTQASSSEYSQPSVNSEASGLKTPIARPYEITQPGTLRQSQDAWRPNASPVIGASHAPTNIPMPVFAPRQSWEAQRPRGGSGSGPNLAFRPDAQQERQWSLQSKTFEQPPSSAQRYPELFRTGQPAMEPLGQNSGDLPAHYYQAPITREAAFLPRQQTNEYQIPGVGPPADEPHGVPRRNSFFKDVGGRISRATSRERRKSIAQEDDSTPGGLRGNSKTNDDADSSIISEDGKERNKRRSGFFSGLGRSSTGLSNAPHSRESVIAHAPSSRTDLGQPPPNGVPQEKKRSFFGGNVSTPPVSKPNKLSRASVSGAPEVTPGKKKRFSGFGIFSGRPDSSGRSTPDRPQATMDLSYNDRQPLASPSNMSNFPPQNQQYTSVPASVSQSYNNGPVQTREGPSTQQRQIHQPSPVQSPQKEPRQPDDPLAFPGTPIHQGQYNQAASQTHGQALQHPKPEIEPKISRSFLSKMRASSAQSPKPHAPQQASIKHQEQEVRPRKASKTRRSSAGGLLGGFMGRKHSHDVNSDGPHTQETQQQTRNMPPRRTYSGTGEQQVPRQSTIRQVEAEPQLQHRHVAPPQEERGRQVSREPQYDSVPIPTGYNLVRAQGGHTVPTDYDPRGYRSHQSGFQSPPANQVYGQASPSSQGRRTPQQTQAVQNSNAVTGQQAPHISALEGHHSFVSRQAPNRLSREDLLARSPALPVEGQQRPYQLSLPENNDERDYPMNDNRSPISPHQSSPHLTNGPGKANAPHDPIQRLQGGPQRENTPSPATYPLPDNVVFSPVVPSAGDFPPPPPPKDSHLLPDHTRNVSNSSYLTTFDLNRSGTHRTAVSAISMISDPPHNDKSIDRHGSNGIISPSARQSRTISNSSPTPPSPVGTPMRIESPAPIVTKPQVYKTTVLEAPRRLSLDLYDASPIGTPLAKPHPNGHIRNHSRQRSGPSTPNLTIQTQQPYTPPPRQVPTISSSQPDSGSNKFAELEGTKADGFNMRLTRQEQEEKIFYDAESGMRGYGDAAPSMSATSYPGQEWNPYGAGAWDDGEEEEDVRVVRR